jgi:hypothetical protein
LTVGRIEQDLARIYFKQDLARFSGTIFEAGSSKNDSRNLARLTVGRIEQDLVVQYFKQDLARFSKNKF